MGGTVLPLSASWSNLLAICTNRDPDLAKKKTNVAPKIQQQNKFTAPMETALHLLFPPSYSTSLDPISVTQVFHLLVGSSRSAKAFT